eukprot:131512-Hanusia_phi.AAC.1
MVQNGAATGRRRDRTRLYRRSRRTVSLGPSRLVAAASQTRVTESTTVVYGTGVPGPARRGSPNTQSHWHARSPSTVVPYTRLAPSVTRTVPAAY